MVENIYVINFMNFVLIAFHSNFLSFLLFSIFKKYLNKNVCVYCTYMLVIW